MGPDDRSVTDTSLRVRGVSGLRVVDTSVLPSPFWWDECYSNRGCRESWQTSSEDVLLFPD
ncbi:GMC family oxidoreductase [Mesorhizobium sp. M1348]